MIASRKFPSACRCLVTATVLALATAIIFPHPAAAQRSSQTKQPPSSAVQGKVRPDLGQFRARLEAILAGAHANKAYWGVLVADRETGATLYEWNADRYFAPASNAKIFTTAFTLAALGPDHRFHTTLESQGALGGDGRLSGDLILVGRGDPDLSNRKFPYAGKVERDGPVERVLAEMADAAVERGLREVDGDIVGDDSYFPYDPDPAGWSVGDLFFTFGAPVSAIAFNENSFSVEVQPGARPGDPVTLIVEPAAALDTFGHELTTVAADLQPDFSVVRRPGTNFILLRGSVPAAHAPIRLDFAMSEPAETAARVLKHLLETRGVRVTGGVHVRHAPPPQRSAKGLPQFAAESAPLLPEANSLVLAEHISPPLIESIRLTNKISQNLHAELFLRTVAREKTGIGSSDDGLRLEQDFFKAAGIADGDVLFSDGAGLARDDLVKPVAVVQLLRYVARQPWGPAYLATMPVAGVDGTLEDRMRQPAVSGLIQAKTGSLEHTHALSGYATTLSGEYLVFAIFGNNDPEHGRDATAVLDTIGAAMIETLGTASHARTRK
jgi:D-alanyl-D-alanine carboxypeptidase/D-alanyl-D-alanine-endopeptidase (penicillin-binding protein 4)